MFEIYGVDWTSKMYFEKLVYVDGLTKLYGYPLGEGSTKNTFMKTVHVQLTGESNIDDIFSAISSGIQQASSSGVIPSLILWDADFLVASEILTPSELLSLIILVQEVSIHYCVVTLNADSVFWSQQKRLSDLEVNYSVFSHAMIYRAHSIISLRPLPSGRTKDVTGIIQLSRGSEIFSFWRMILIRSSARGISICTFKELMTLFLRGFVNTQYVLKRWIHRPLTQRQWNGLHGGGISDSSSLGIYFRNKEYKVVFAFICLCLNYYLFISCITSESSIVFRPACAAKVSRSSETCSKNLSDTEMISLIASLDIFEVVKFVTSCLIKAVDVFDTGFVEGFVKSGSENSEYVFLNDTDLIVLIKFQFQKTRHLED
ncbi:hypothetical protein PCK2_000593 [Pneumocystis canis]|nr:hypothetical protein PCK2_000593 [Pneumocystis canis]